MIRSSKRSLYTAPHDSTSRTTGKQPKRLQHARKFASIQPISPTKKIVTTKLGKPHKAEDFLEFLCVRHLPALPSELDVFMEPPGPQQQFFSDDDSDDEIPLAQSVRLAKEAERRTLTKSPPNNINSKLKDGECDGNEQCIIGKIETCNPNPNGITAVADKVSTCENSLADETRTFNSADPKKICNSVRPQKDGAPTPPHSHIELLNEKSPLKITEIECTCIKLPDQKYFFKCMRDIRVSQGDLALVSPPENVKVVSYVLHNINLSIQTKHIHRLKHSHGKSFLTSSAMMKQLERESVPIRELPKIGLCEVDLPLLRDVVNSFGGIECVNRDQCWKLVADHMSILKTASRRMQQIETIYLKYILPYETLPEADQMRLQRSVLSCGVDEIWPVENSGHKNLSLVIFKKMVDAYSNMYCKGVSLSTEGVEKLFWEIVSKGETHACGTCGMIDLLKEPKDYENSKLTVCWRMQDIFSLEGSALKYLGSSSKLTAPWLLFEGIFNTCRWTKQEFGFSIISYLHQGSDRIWYVIPQEDSQRFEKLRSRLNDLVPPLELISDGCNVRRCVQKEGQYVVVQPNCYYCTLSTGYCMSENVTFAALDWFSSKTFTAFQPRLDEVVITKIILLSALSDCVDEVRSLYGLYLVSKLEAIKELLRSSLQRIREAGVTATEYLVLGEIAPANCTYCDQVCYLVRVKSKSSSCICVEDVCSMTRSNRDSEMVVELGVSVENIEDVLTQLKRGSIKTD